MKNSWRPALEEAKAEDRHPIHSFHRYFGKLIPGIPRFAVREFTAPGDRVIDTFAGSGTTLVEAFQLGRHGTGTDRNPLATFICRVKTTPLDQAALLAELELVMTRFEEPTGEQSDFDEPYVVNIDHWFRPEVKRELLKLRAAIQNVENEDHRQFFLGCFSAFIRNVSNADPQHVFPGFSKRMRALEAAGREIDVAASFRRAVRKRANQVAALDTTGHPPATRTGAADQLEELPPTHQLAVINPPYISSIRYLETMKIEMGWLGFVDSKATYLAMDREMTGTERYYKRDLVEIPSTSIKELDSQVDRLRTTNPKMAKVVAEYFVSMRAAYQALGSTVVSGGALVVKISDSRVRGEVLETSKHFVRLADEAGFSLMEDILDEFSPNSRSLLTARNSYSGIMMHDHVLVFERR